MPVWRLKHLISLRSDQYAPVDQLTNTRNDLRLQSDLILEASCNVADTALSITNNVRHFSDLVEHMS